MADSNIQSASAIANPSHAPVIHRWQVDSVEELVQEPDPEPFTVDIEQALPVPSPLPRASVRAHSEEAPHSGTNTSEPSLPPTSANRDALVTSYTPAFPERSPHHDSAAGSIAIRGSRKKKKIYPHMEMKSYNYNHEQHCERGDVVIEELKRTVDSDHNLKWAAETTNYSLFMVGTTPETAEPSIVITSKTADTKALRSLFKKKATDKLFCHTGSRIWRLFKQDRKPGRPPFRLVYRQTEENDIVRMASSADLLTTRCNYPDTFCGALVKHQGQQATVALSLLIDGRYVLLTVDHLFPSATETSGLVSASPGSTTSLDTLPLQAGSVFSDSDTLNDDDFLSFNQLWADDDDDEYDDDDIEVHVKSSMNRDKATSFCEASSQDDCGGTENLTSPQLFDGEKIYPVSATRDSRPYLDFSLIQVDAGVTPSRLSNKIYPSGPTGTPVPLDSIATSPRHHGAKVYVVSASSGLRSGSILKSFSYLGSKPGQQMCKVWTVIFDSGGTSILTTAR